MEKNLKNTSITKTAVIIGASSDIGFEITKTFAAKGYSLALTYNTNRRDFEKAIDAPMKVYHLNLLTDDIIKFFKQVEEDFKYIDTLIYCPAIAHKSLILDITDSEIDDVYKVNLVSATKCIKHFAHYILDKHHPASILLLGSCVEKYGCSCESVYSSTKSGMDALAKSLATELGSFGIRINVLAPGFIDTKMNGNLNKKEKAEIIEMTALKRIGTSEDIAKAAYFLSSEDASYITGTTLYVDGGLILG